MSLSQSEVTTAAYTYLGDVPKSIDVWHGGGLIRTHDYFPCLFVNLHAQLVQTQNFGFRGSASKEKEKKGKKSIKEGSTGVKKKNTLTSLMLQEILAWNH